MFAFSGIRNRRSLGSKVAMVLHAAVGSPQIGPCLTSLRFCADIAGARKLSVAVVMIKASTAKRSRFKCVDVLLKLIMFGLLILVRSWILAPIVLEIRGPASPIAVNLHTNILGQRPIGIQQSGIENILAERVGFEPTERFPAHSISSAANSTTLAPLRRQG